MKVYQDLEFHGSAPALNQFIVELESRLSAGWERRHDREKEVRKKALGAMYCFSCTAAGTRPECLLWIATMDGALYVANILATDYPSLTYDQYNSVLQEFHDHFSAPAAQAVGAEVCLGNPNPQLRDYLSESTASLLQAFSDPANKSILHPLDRKRWNEFLTAAHREGTTLPAGMLKRWLIEEGRWPVDAAIELASEYELARGLLEVYESQHAQ